MNSQKRERIKKIVLEQLALLSFELIIVVILSVAAILTFYKISSLLLENEITNFDRSSYQYIRNFSSPFFDQFMLSATFLGNRQFIIFPALALLAYYLFIKPHRWYSIKIPAVALGSISTNILLKELYDRARPTVFQMVEASGLSFPSGHAMFNLSFYGLLIYIISKEVKNQLIKSLIIVLLAFIIISIGLSRIYLGVHYSSDVLAGFCAGFLWLIIALFVTNSLERRIKKKKQLQAKADSEKV